MYNNSNLKYKQYFQNENNYQNTESSKQMPSRDIQPNYQNQFPFNYGGPQSQLGYQNMNSYQIPQFQTMQQPNINDVRNQNVQMQYQQQINQKTNINPYSNLKTNQKNIVNIDYSKDPTESMIQQAHESLRLLKSKRPNSREDYFQKLEQGFPMKPKGMDRRNGSNNFQQNQVPQSNQQQHQNVQNTYQNQNNDQNQQSGNRNLNRTQNQYQNQGQQVIQQNQQVQRGNNANTAPQFKQRQLKTIQDQNNQKKQIDNDDDRPAYRQGIVEPIIENQNQQTFECKEGCGRRFIREVLDKHQAVCKKVFQQQRKKFDAAQKRMVSQEQVQLLKLSKKNNNASKQPTGKQPKWKMQSQAFRAILKQNQGGTVQMTQQEQQNLKDQMDEAQGLQPCNHCGRKFNEQAHKRHVPFCKDKQEKDAFKKGFQKKR